MYEIFPLLFSVLSPSLQGWILKNVYAFVHTFTKGTNLKIHVQSTNFFLYIEPKASRWEYSKSYPTYMEPYRCN